MIEVALELLEAEGVAGLSMRKIGRRLGVEAMSLYHHVPDKAAIVDGIVAAIYAEIPADDLPVDAPWTEQLAVGMSRFRAVLLRHPAAVPLVVTRSVTGVAGMRLLDALLQLLRRAGFDSQTAISVINCAAAFTSGHCLAWSERSTPEFPRPGPEQTLHQVAALPAAQYPGVWWALGPCLDGSAPTDGVGLASEAEFELGLRALLDGLNRSLRPAAL